MATFTSNNYDGRYLQLSISESVNVAGNSSTLNWTLTSAGGSSSYYTIDATDVIINGTSVYSKERTNWETKVFPAAKGSVSGSITVPHNSDGTKTVTVVFTTRVYIFGVVDYRRMTIFLPHRRSVTKQSLRRCKTYRLQSFTRSKSIRLKF